MKAPTLKTSPAALPFFQGARLFIIFALVIAFGAAWTWFNRLPEIIATPTLAQPHTGFAAPNFALSSTTAETFTLADLKGKVVLVNFWAAWCPSCRAEMPAIDAAYRANKDVGFVVLAVDQMESAEMVKTFGTKYNLSFPLLLDSDGAINRQYLVSALPTSFFIDRRGVIRDMIIGGSMSREFVEGKIKALLEEKE
ncbi:MAG: redoxin domain-containing protein [Anaerolineae bacterium]|nr:redoxin domain-containing protein [Anaerolineae bacterium]